jgi:hypothetical protein
MSDWTLRDDRRDIGQSSVSKNVSQAERKLQA